MKTEAEIGVIDTSANQGKPRAAGNHQKLGEKHETDSPSESSGRTSCAHTLISDFPPPEQSENKLVVICYSSHRKLKL